MGHKCDSHVDDKVDDAYDSYNTTYLQSRIQEWAIGNQKILGLLACSSNGFGLAANNKQDTITV
jgi:hypothetical protein